jgi:XTP/dITP diphosphohydrolase
MNDAPTVGSQYPRLVIATGNSGKLAEFRRLLERFPLNFVGIHNGPVTTEIEESGASYEENAGIKAVAAAKHFKDWALGDDTGLEVDALKGAPGLLTARFAGLNANAKANREKLLAELEQVPLELRSARFVCHLALSDPDGIIRAIATGACHGRITHSPQGPQTFGYDSLFELIEYHRTFADLGDDAKTCLTHRARAVYQIAPRLINLLTLDK